MATTLTTGYALLPVPVMPKRRAMSCADIARQCVFEGLLVREGKIYYSAMQPASNRILTRDLRPRQDEHDGNNTGHARAIRQPLEITAAREHYPG